MFKKKNMKQVLYFWLGRFSFHCLNVERDTLSSSYYWFNTGTQENVPALLKIVDWDVKHQRKYKYKGLILNAPITTAADDKFYNIFFIFEKYKVWYFTRIVCQQTILVKHYALFVLFF